MIFLAHNQDRQLIFPVHIPHHSKMRKQNLNQSFYTFFSILSLCNNTNILLLEVEKSNHKSEENERKTKTCFRHKKHPKV